MTEKIFDFRAIVLSDGLICFELERVVLNDENKDILAFHLTHYSCEDPNSIFIDELKYFDKINELDNYIDKKISEFKAKGFK